ncbi:MAG: DNA polymerase ligase N-terminal domain-containing protein [Spirochaetota bacterium]
MRFVIQHHAGKDEHYDLMIEQSDADALLTWKIGLADMNLLLSGSHVNAERLADHRKEYLDYEGPVSKGRGSVRIFDRGECTPLTEKDNASGFMLEGRKLAGNIMLKKNENGFFTISYSAKQE